MPEMQALVMNRSIILLFRGKQQTVQLFVQIVIYSGIGLSIVPAITLLFFDDDKFLKDEEEEGAVAKDGPATGAVYTCPVSCP